MLPNGTNLIGWGLAACGFICGVAAAFIQGGKFAALTAASAGFTSMAGLWGYTSRTTPTN